jgi:hypothetical protein
MNHGTKFCRLGLKLLLPTILTSSLPFYPYQKDELALPGYLLTRCSFLHLWYKARLAFPQRFSVFFYSYNVLCHLSLSLSLQSVKGKEKVTVLLISNFGFIDALLYFSEIPPPATPFAVDSKE